MTVFVLLFLAAYLAGSVNFAILLFRFKGWEDPRRHHSGNPGATNVWRQAGVGWAVVVLLLEMAKALAIALIGLAAVSPSLVPWLGLALILGNRFPCWHGFKGGKGVANYLGFSVVLAPLAAVLGMVCWLALYLTLRQPFISSFGLVLVIAGGTIWNGPFTGTAVAGVVATALQIFYNHKSNLAGYFTKDGNKPG